MAQNASMISKTTEEKKHKFEVLQKKQNAEQIRRSLQLEHISVVTFAQTMISKK